MIRFSAWMTATPREPARRPGPREPVATHIEGFIDDVDDDLLRGGSFQRVSDDESDAPAEAASYAADGKPKQLRSQPRGAARKSRVGKLLGSLGSKKKTSSKRSSKKPTKELAKSDDDADSEGVAAGDSAIEEAGYVDAEARLDDSGSRAEFATRRGGRRRRRPSKSAAADTAVGDATAEDAPASDDVARV